MLHPPFLYNEWWGFVKLPASRLRDFENHYKIKLKKAGFRLVYEVLDDEKSLLVAVGKMADNLVYRKAQERSNRLLFLKFCYDVFDGFCYPSDTCLIHD